MNVATEIDSKDERPSKDESWRAHASLLCSSDAAVGGATCQSRFASSKTAVPLFREEAKSTCCAADQGSPYSALTTKTAGAGPGRRCQDTKQDGTWRYSFEEMKWVLDRKEHTEKDRAVEALHTTEDRRLGRDNPPANARSASHADDFFLRARIEQLENTLKQHGIPLPPSLNR